MVFIRSFAIFRSSMLLVEPPFMGFGTRGLARTLINKELIMARWPLLYHTTLSPSRNSMSLPALTRNLLPIAHISEVEEPPCL